MSGGDAAAALHRGLVTALKADATIAGLVADRIYEWPGDDATYPMITVGDYTSTPWDTDTSVGSEIDITVHTWARGPSGRVVARRIGEAVTDLLHRQRITAAGYIVVDVQRTFADVWRDEASEATSKSDTAHGVYRYHAVLDYTG